MTLPEFMWTEGLVEALKEVEDARTDLFINGDAHGNEITLSDLDHFVELVRKADLELVKAREEHRDREFYPYYPTSYDGEQSGYEAVTELLEAPLPTAPEGVEIGSVSR